MLDNEKTRAVVGNFVNPIANLMIKAGVSSNAITLIGTLGISISALLFFPTGNFFWGTLIILIFVLSDLLDGTVARLSGSVNPVGAFLDSTMDRITDAALFGSIVIYYSSQDSIMLLPALITAFCAQLISYIRAKAESVNIPMKIGIAERPERMILLLIGTGFTGLGLSNALDFAVALLSFLTVYTVLQRMKAAYQAISK